MEYTSINDDEALDAFSELSRLEGIIPALESAHAVAQAKKLKLPKDQIAVVNLSGRGDKDVNEAMRLIGREVARTERKVATRFSGEANSPPGQEGWRATSSEMIAKLP